MPEKYTVVVGLGVTGLSCVRFLHKKKIKVCVADTREQPPQLPILKEEFPDVPLYLGTLPEEVLLNAEQIIVSPGLPLIHPALQAAKKAGIKIRGDIDLFVEYAKAPIVGVTGANGKSTVTAWVAAMGQSCGKKILMGGNIGIPVLDLLKEDTPDAYVLELSSFQLESTAHLPLKGGSILNITPDHQDRYPTMAAYAAAKQLIYHQCENAIYYRADNLTVPITSVKQYISFGLDAPETKQYGIIKTTKGDFLAYGKKQLLEANQISLPGEHNILNALAATALARSLNLPWEGIIRSLQNFEGLPHRCQKVAEYNGITWVNDSKGTNVVSTLAAIQAMSKKMEGKLIMILGGDGKGADFSPLAEPLQAHSRANILLGKDAAKLQEALLGYVNIYLVEDLNQAVQQAAALAYPGDIVLLSPACASLDMFVNYVQRGEIFMKLVRKMMEL